MTIISPSFAIFARQKREKAMKVVFLTVLILAVCVLLLGVKVFFVRGGKFPSGHAHDIPQLRRRTVKNNKQNIEPHAK